MFIVNKLSIYLSTLLAVITISLLNPHPIFAAATELSFTPATTEILLAPNKNIIQTFDFLNQGESGQFVASLHGIMPTGNEGLAVIDPTPLDPTTLPLLISLQNADLKLDSPFTVASGESLQLVLRVEAANVDQTVDAHFALVVSTYNTISSLAAKAGISSLIFTTITPDGVLPIKLSVENLVVPTFVDSQATIHLSPLLVNDSPVMIRPVGHFNVISPNGRHDQEFSLFPSLILGHTKRLISLQTGNPPTNTPFTWTPPKGAIGLYTLRLTINTPGGIEIQKLEKSVWVLPIRLTLALITTIFISLLFLVLARRKHPIDTPL